MQEITQKDVRSLFDYHNGSLYWKKLTSSKSRIRIGSKAGSLSVRGYCKVKIECKSYSAHRLIYLYHHGYLPKYLDHIDNNPSNNNIENLREVTASQNCMNRNSHKNTSSKYKGVCWHKQHNKWQAHIRINGKKKHLGYFNDEKAAAFIYNVYARGLFSEFACLNKIGR